MLYKIYEFKLDARIVGQVGGSESRWKRVGKRKRERECVCERMKSSTTIFRICLYQTEKCGFTRNQNKLLCRLFSTPHTCHTKRTHDFLFAREHETCERSTTNRKIPFVFIGCMNVKECVSADFSVLLFFSVVTFYYVIRAAAQSLGNRQSTLPTSTDTVDGRERCWKWHSGGSDTFLFSCKWSSIVCFISHT